MTLARTKETEMDGFVRQDPAQLAYEMLKAAGVVNAGEEDIVLAIAGLMHLADEVGSGSLDVSGESVVFDARRHYYGEVV